VASKKNDKPDDDGETSEDSHGPQECMPCRGSGQLISNLGGTASTVVCPWCEGTGKRLASVDAQHTWLDQQDPDAEGAASPSDTAA
jgi:DnaJ-class molecular chaperone